MTWRGRRRRAAIAAAILVLVPVAAWLGLQTAFPEARLRALLEPRLEAALGRAISIESARIRLVPLSIRVGGIRVEPEAAEEPPLQIETLAATLDVWPLFGRRIVVRSLRIERPTLRLHQAEDGRWSGPAGSSPRPAAGTPAPASAPVGLQIDRLQIHAGSVHVRSNRLDLAFDAPLECELRLRADRELRHVQLQGWIASNGIVPGGRLSRMDTLALRIEPDLELDVPDSTARVERIGVTLQGLTLELAGTASVTDAKPQFALATRSQAIDLAALLSLVPRGLIPALDRFTAEGTARIDLQIEKPRTGDPVILGSLYIDAGRFTDAALPESIDNVQLRATFDRGELRVDELSARVAGSPVRASGRVMQPLIPDSTAFALDIAATLDLRRAAGLGKLPPGVRVAGTARANVNVSGTTRAPERAMLRGPIDLDGVRIETPQLGVPLQLDAHLEGAGSGLRIERADMRAGTSLLQLGGNIVDLLSGSARRIELQARSGELDLDAILPAAGAARATSGSAGADTVAALIPALPPVPLHADIAVATLRASGARIDGLRLGLDSNARDLRLDVHAAGYERDKLRLRNVRASLRGTPAQAAGPVHAESGELDKLSARSLQGNVRVAGTTVTLDSLTAQAYDGRLHGELRVDLSNVKTPAYDLRIDVDQVEVGALTGAFVPGGRVVSGRMNGSSRWSGQAGEPAVVRSSLNATGQGITVEGRLREFPVLDAVASLLQLPGLSNLPYKDLGFRFDVAAGRVHVPELRLAATDADMTALGSIGLDGSLDVDLNVVLSQALSRRYAGGSTLQQLFAAPDGRVVLDFDVGGTLKAPRVKPNLDATAARGLRALDARELARLLGGLLGPSPAAPDSQARPLDKALDDAQKRLGDRLRSGLGGLLDRKPAAPDTTRKP